MLTQHGDGCAFFVLIIETSLALRYSKQLDREHFPGSFTGAQAKAAQRDHRDHREGGGSREGDPVRQPCDGALGGAPVHGRGHYLRVHQRL